MATLQINHVFQSRMNVFPIASDFGLAIRGYGDDKFGEVSGRLAGVFG